MKKVLQKKWPVLLKAFIKKFAAVAMATLILLMGLLTMQNNVVRAETWSFIDGGGTNGINYNASEAASTPRIIDFEGTLYAIWSEGAAGVTQIRVKKFVNNEWVTADNNATLNQNSAKNAQNPVFEVYNNELYAAWQEAGTVYWQIRVKKFNGTSWVSVDGNDAANGINYNNSNNGRNVRLITYAGNLYAMWDEALGSGINQARVKRYNGSSWAFVDGGTASAGMNKDSSMAAQLLYPAVFDGKLYVIWSEGTSTIQTRVKAYNGTSWTFVDGNGTNGLNKDTSKWAQNASLAVYDNALYAAWSETSAGQNQIRVKKYDGTSWSFVDGDGATGINQNTGNSAYIPRLAVFGDNLYVTWYEGTPNFRIRVKKYDGSSWISADGNGTGGINKSSSAGAQYGYMAESDGSLYVVWQESNGTANQIRVVLKGPDNSAPTATGVSFTGTLKEGHTLTGTYTYADTESDPEGTTTFKWYTADNAAGANKTVIAGAASPTLALTSAHTGKYIIFEVTPVASTGAASGAAASYTSASDVVANAAPTATGVQITGEFKLNHLLTGTYTYSDADGDAEGLTEFKWYTADNAAGANKTEIPGANGKTLVLKAPQFNKFVLFEATPVALSGTLAGAPVGSAWAGPAGVLYGDANGDGLVTPADALIVNRYVSGKIELTDEQKAALDMDNDGDVDANDAKIILNIYNGIGA